MRATLALGLVLAGVFAVLSWRLWGEPAAFAAAVFGGLAVAIQLTALGLMRPARGAPLERFIARWGAGMGLRLLGILALALAAGLDPRHFPPLATATGFLGVLLPLLFLEARLIR